MESSRVSLTEVVPVRRLLGLPVVVAASFLLSITLLGIADGRPARTEPVQNPSASFAPENTTQKAMTLVIPASPTPICTAPATVVPAPPLPVPEITPSPTPVPLPSPPGEVDEERWIDVDLSQQQLTAYERRTPVRTTPVSTGLPRTPTPAGQFRIWTKLRYDDMAGPGYFLADVPFVMYFYRGYGLHAATWHANFGQPMSHGCVNLPEEEAAWLFDWAGVGTLVNVHD